MGWVTYKARLSILCKIELVNGKEKEIEKEKEREKRTTLTGVCLCWSLDRLGVTPYDTET
jgi:hypothetical protein